MLFFLIGNTLRSDDIARKLEAEARSDYLQNAQRGVQCYQT